MSRSKIRVIRQIWSLGVGYSLFQSHDLTDLLPSADTVVLTQDDIRQELLEKPLSKEDNLRMLLDLNGSVCEVVTGVSLGRNTYRIQVRSNMMPCRSLSHTDCPWIRHQVSNLLPLSVNLTRTTTAIGSSMNGLWFTLQKILKPRLRPTSRTVREPIALVDLQCRFVLDFNFNSTLRLTPPYHSQGLGGLLIRKIDGDFNNVVGFPGASFFKMLDMLVEEDDDFLSST